MSYSADGGQNWTAVAVPGLNDFTYIQAAAYGNGKFVAVTSGGQVLTSTDGRSWAVALDMVESSSGTPDLWDIAFGNGVFLIMGTSTEVGTATWKSTDGVSWSPARAVGFSFGSTLTQLLFVNGTFYHVGEGLLGQASGTGETWSGLQVTVSGQSVVVGALSYGKGIYVAVTDTGYLATSTDFSNWTIRRQLDPNGALITLDFANGNFLLLMGNLISVSTDGSTWVDSPTGNSGDSFNGVAFDGTRYVATGYPGLTAVGIIA